MQTWLDMLAGSLPILRNQVCTYLWKIAWMVVDGAAYDYTVSLRDIQTRKSGRYTAKELLWH